MGFLSDLGKALMGQTPQASDQQPVPHVSDGVRDERGYKIMPKIEVKDVHSHLNGNHLIVTAWFENTSDQRIRIDSCSILKQKKQFNQDFAPQHAHELRLYDGPAPLNENERQARIVYRLLINGDTFENTYRIGYSLESQNRRIIEALYLDGTRDI